MQDHWKGLGRHGTVGLDFLLSIVFGYVAGRWLDQKLHTNGLLTILGFCLGVIAGFRAIYTAAQRMRRETEQADEEERKRRADLRNPKGNGPESEPPKDENG